MASNFDGEFARLVPHNHRAQVLFSQAAGYLENDKAGTQDSFHLQFMFRTKNELFRAGSETVEESTDYDEPGSGDKYSSFQIIQILGHFSLSLDGKQQPSYPHIGWRVGKGSSKLLNRGVDLLLSKPGVPLSKSLAGVHMLFQFNPVSGFLLLKGGSPKTPVIMNTAGKWEVLEYEERRVIYQRATMLRIGACEYELKYIVEEQHRTAYFKRRLEFLATVPGSTEIQLAFQIMPGDSCVLRGKYLEFATQGSGAFGWITRGVDVTTGHPVAIKELRIKTATNRSAAKAEVRMGRSFQVRVAYSNSTDGRSKSLQDKRGLLPILDAWCEHLRPDPCSSPERFYIFMPFAQSDFTAPFWGNVSIPRATKLCWLREPLEGIATLHAMGIMHRDITRKNMLIVSGTPPRASLCDYDKATVKAEDTCTTLGPIPTVAPEVWAANEERPYTNKIDLWSYGYALAEVLGCPLKMEKITKAQHSHVLHELSCCSLRMPEDEMLVSFLIKLLSWDSADRLSAADALEHECWNLIRHGQETRHVKNKVETGIYFSS